MRIITEIERSDYDSQTHHFFKHQQQPAGSDDEQKTSYIHVDFSQLSLKAQLKTGRISPELKLVLIEEPYKCSLDNLPEECEKPLTAS